MVRLVFTVVFLLAASAHAAGDRSPDLDAAEKALDELRYEEADRLLERSWRSGDNGPAALRRLYRLQGEVAATLGDERAARAAFARWLSIAPDAALPAGTSPKIVAPFEAARAAGKDPLRVRHEIDGTTVVVIVDADPLGLVAGARASYSGGTVSARGAARMALALPDEGRFEVVVAVVDGYGNRLVELGVDEAIVVGHEPVTKLDVEEPEPPPKPKLEKPKRRKPQPEQQQPPPVVDDGAAPLYANPWLWGGLTVAAVGSGLTFALLASSAQDELDTLNAESSSHPFSEADLVERRLHRDVLAANVSFGVAVGLAAVTTYVLVVRRPAARKPGGRQVGAAPMVAPGTLGFALEVPW